MEQLIYKETFGKTWVVWGLTAGDTGDLNDPESWTQLLLDDTFDPSKPEAQIYLRDFCPSLFKEEFAMKETPDYECVMNKFDDWLKAQHMYANFAPSKVDSTYRTYCAGATRLPISEESFHSCIINWSRSKGVSDILSRDGIVKIIDVNFFGRSLSNTPNREINREWNMVNDWMIAKQTNAPPGVDNGIFGNVPFWLHDTQNEMFSTAYKAGGGALLVAAIVILFHSKSITMTLFAVLSIGYILASVTAMIYYIGWALGFLESICFSILIGISVDYVIHFCHAYVTVPGNEKYVPRSERTKFALISMGPSILAAAFTTISSSIFMLFTELLFFRKFGIILTFTVIQAVIGSFVVLLTLTDLFGPSNPTHTVDRVLGFIARCFDKKKNDNTMSLF